MSLWIMINLKNVMKVFAYYGKDESFYKYFRILRLQHKKIDCLVQSKYIQLDVSDCHFC